MTDLHIVEITQSYRHLCKLIDALSIYTQQKLLSLIDTNKVANTLHTIYTQQKLLSLIDALHDRLNVRHLHIVEITQSYRLTIWKQHQIIIYTQQKLLSLIDGGASIPRTWIYTQQKLLSLIDYIIVPVWRFIYTQQKLLSLIDPTLCIIGINIYTQQKLLSLIDLCLCFGAAVIYTQQKLLSLIDGTHSLKSCPHLHIVEITQSYRLRFIKQQMNNLHIVEITQSYRRHNAIA